MSELPCGMSDAGADIPGPYVFQTVAAKSVLSLYCRRIPLPSEYAESVLHPFLQSEWNPLHLEAVPLPRPKAWSVYIPPAWLPGYVPVPGQAVPH